MGLKHSLKQLGKLAIDTQSEITFSENGSIDWYWKSLRFQPEPEDVPKLVEAIKALTEIGGEVN
jgi:hypothetical protein